MRANAQDHRKRLGKAPIRTVVAARCGVRAAGALITPALFSQPPPHPPGEEGEVCLRGLSQGPGAHLFFFVAGKTSRLWTLDKEIAVRDPLGRIIRCSACCLLGLGLPALAAGAAPLPPTGFDRPPLLLIHWTTDTIAAQHIDTSVVIHAAGATEITEITDG